MPRATSRAKLGSAIRAVRIEQGTSQEGLAERCGLHRTYIGSIERGERNPSLDNIVKIARALHQEASDLLLKAGL